jgi:hypothetical protein
METYIPEQDIYARIKMHPDLTPADKKEFDRFTRSLYLSTKGKANLAKPVVHNQQRTPRSSKP